MKAVITICVSILLMDICSAQNNQNYRYQKGYVKKTKGVYVRPHYKTQTNTTNHDNYSTKPNTNPWNGKKGSRAKDYSPDANNYGRGKYIQTGPKGGQYYKSYKNNKTYIPKRK